MQYKNLDVIEWISLVFICLRPQNMVLDDVFIKYQFELSVTFFKIRLIN